MERLNQTEKEFEQRLAARYDELKWLYCELYHNDMHAFEWLCNSLAGYYRERPAALKERDREREQNPDWYRRNDLLGMMMYTDAFAGTLQGVKEKLDYIERCGVNYLHLMPLLESPKGRDDGGYAVADFRKVQPELGTIDDLKELTGECHKRGINCCMDFVMNHTSEDHAWARAARAGDEEAKRRYFFYDNWEIPKEYDRIVPQVFPTTAPGNFTWLEDCGQIVMTTFYPFQWDLNYANCVVFNDMTGNMLFLANCGIDVIRLDAVPYIWKEFGTCCRNLPQVHNLVRMLRLICEIVCPGVLLLGEVVMEPAKVAPYFGTTQKPECHMLYNVTTMASTWHTIATRDVSLLRHQLEQVCGLPREYVFLNYLRCHDDIGWGLDYDWLLQSGMEQKAHKRYLNDYFTGKWEGSPSRGELYNDDPRLGDARLCGTTASLCGLETALSSGDEEKINQAVSCIEMLHAYLFCQSGIPVLYSGDEIGQQNDYSYKKNPDKQADSRNLHRGKFPWAQVEDPVSQGIFHSLRRMEQIRASHRVFDAAAQVQVLDTGNPHVLALLRKAGDKQVIGIFNFSEEAQTIDPEAMMGSIGKAADGVFSDLLSKKRLCADIEGYGYGWYCKKG